MNSLKEYFHTDWAAMTLNDWVGLLLTLITAILIAGAYIYVFHPKNKARLESQRHIPLDDDDEFKSEDKR